MKLINGLVLGASGEFERRELSFGERIGESADGEVMDVSGCYVLPGLVDIHTHGALGCDFSDGEPEQLQTLAGWYAKNGVTSFLATTMTLKEPELTRSMLALRDFKSKSARCAGVHLEGPFLSYAKRGAQNPDNLHAPDYAMLCRLNDASGGMVRLVTVAPEEPGAVDFIKNASRLCCVSLGHSGADYDTAMAAYEAGARHATHLFNGMPPLHHRAPGIIGAAFDSGATVELIADGLHIHPAVMRCARALFSGRYAFISDSLRCAGMPDGEYELGGLPVKLAGGIARLADGTIAGSSISLLDGLRRTVDMGFALAEAARAASTVPAQIAGLSDVGELSCGKLADIIVLDNKLALRAVFIGGKRYIA